MQYLLIYIHMQAAKWMNIAAAHGDTNKYASTLKWDALAAHESFPAWLPAGYSFLRPSEICNSSQGGA